MNLAELRALLDREGVDPTCYALDAREMGTRVEAYRIGIHHKHWCVWYSERGMMLDEHRFASEDEACRYLLEVLRPPAGGVNQVLRLGSTVHRPAGPWTPAVHALLSHLADVGFDGAPQPKGVDEAGREVLSYVPGDVTDYPLADYAGTDQALCEVAALLRRYHDATVDFTPPDGAVWRVPPMSPVEVICHGDIAHYTCVFRNGHPVAFIDFDHAHPGPRRWDVAHAAYRFAPLTAPTNPDFTLPLDQQMIRLRLFCDTYGLGREDRDVLPETVAARLRALLDTIHQRAAASDEAFRRHLTAPGADELYRADIAHVEANATHLRRAVRM